MNDERTIEEVQAELDQAMRNHQLPLDDLDWVGGDTVFLLEEELERLRAKKSKTMKEELQNKWSQLTYKKDYSQLSPAQLAVIDQKIESIGSVGWNWKD